MTFQPRDYQEEALQQLMDCYQRGVSACVLSPTGSGKGWLIAWFMQRLLSKQPDLRIAVVAHRIEILEDIEGRMGESTVEYRTIQYLNRRVGDPDFLYDVIIYDECHHASSESYRKVTDANSKWHCGFTATSLRGLMPNYPDGIEVLQDEWKIHLHGIKSDNLFQEFILTKSTGQLIQEGFLCDFKLIHDKDFHIQHLGKNTSLDFTDRDVRSAISVEEIVSYINETVDGRQAIVFAHSIDYCNKIAEQLGEQSYSLTSKSPKDERNRKTAEFKEGKLQILISCDIISEGFDCPSTDCVYFFAPTKSIVKYAQQLGRGLRPDPDNPNKVAIIYDYVNNYGRLKFDVKHVQLEEMVLEANFAKETCEFCGASKVIENKTNKTCGSVPNAYVKTLTDWLSENQGKWEWKLSMNGRKTEIGLLPDAELDSEQMLEYAINFYKQTFPTYIMPVIKNQYGRWEILSPKNASTAIDRKQTRVIEVMGGCKYSDAEHPYFIISDNLVKRKVNRTPKIKM